MHALPKTTADQADSDKAQIAVRLLQLAVSDPAGELDRPSEWIARDPGLLSLDQDEEFKAFVKTQENVDFDPTEPEVASAKGAYWRAIRIHPQPHP
jgi:hypothetical protein